MTTKTPKDAGAMPTPRRTPDSMKRPPLEVADLSLQVLAFLLTLALLFGVDGPPPAVAVLVDGLALVMKLWLFWRGE